MKAEIVIATFNGGERLKKTLSSFLRMRDAQQTPEDEWRIIIVDNNSTDHTANTVNNFSDRLPVSVISAPQPGKSAALNSVIPKLSADLIIFTDDDVEVETNWLDNLLEASETHKDYDVFAGRIVGHWEKELPARLKSVIPLGSTYAIHGDNSSGPCDPGLVWGPNMAIRRSVFDKGHLYNEKIGPQPKALYPMGQDSEMAKRLFAAGHKSYFLSDAIVHHTVKAATVTENWIIKRAERLGYGIFAVEESRKNYKRKFPLLPLEMEIMAMRIRCTLLYPFTFIFNDKHKFWVRWGYYYYRGLYKGYKEFVA